MSFPSVVVPHTSVTTQVSLRIPVVSMTSKYYCRNRPQEISQWSNKFPHLLTLFRYSDIVEFYVYGSVHRCSVLITVQRDATQSSVFIILQVHSTHSTCLGCQPRPSSGIHKTLTTASGTGHIFVQLPPSNVAKLDHVGMR